MKKIVCISIIAIAICIALPFGMTSVSATSNHNSVPMSSQEMQSGIGGCNSECTSMIYENFGFYLCWTGCGIGGGWE